MDDGCYSVKVTELRRMAHYQIGDGQKKRRYRMIESMQCNGQFVQKLGTLAHLPEGRCHRASTKDLR